MVTTEHSLIFDKFIDLYKNIDFVINNMVRSYNNGTPVFLELLDIYVTHQITFIFQQLIYIPNNFISQQKY